MWSDAAYRHQQILSYQTRVCYHERAREGEKEEPNGDKRNTGDMQSDDDTLLVGGGVNDTHTAIRHTRIERFVRSS